MDTKEALGLDVFIQLELWLEKTGYWIIGGFTASTYGPRLVKDSILTGLQFDDSAFFVRNMLSGAKNWYMYVERLASSNCQTSVQDLVILKNYLRK